VGQEEEIQTSPPDQGVTQLTLVDQVDQGGLARLAQPQDNLELQDKYQAAAAAAAEMETMEMREALGQGQQEPLAAL
jgi:hypothetical protein